MTISNEPRWNCESDCLPEPGVVPPPYLSQNDNGERSATDLTYRVERFGQIFFQVATYSCAHHRTTFHSRTLAAPEPPSALARLVLALHAFSGWCHCFRPDWVTYVNEPPTKRGMTEALKLALHRRDHEECCYLTFEARDPIGPVLKPSAKIASVQAA